ncbi:MAG: hypothetical protein WAO91_03800 [Candidatus Nitrosotenuis sp.]
MMQKITQKLRAKNVRNIPRHKVGFYSLIGVVSAAAVILAVFL